MIATSERLVLLVDKSKLSEFLTMLKLFDFVQVETSLIADLEYDEYEENLSEMEIAKFEQAMKRIEQPEHFVSHEHVKNLVQQWLNRQG